MINQVLRIYYCHGLYPVIVSRLASLSVAVEELLEALEDDSELATDESEPEAEPELDAVLDVTEPDDAVEADDELPVLLFVLLEEEALSLLDGVVGVSPISP